MHRDIVS